MRWGLGCCGLELGACPGALCSTGGAGVVRHGCGGGIDSIENRELVFWDGIRGSIRSGCWRSCCLQLVKQELKLLCSRQRKPCMRYYSNVFGFV